MESITITLTNQPNGLRIQGTCQNLSSEDVQNMLDTLQYEIYINDLMEGLNRDNGGYFETTIEN